MPRNQAQIGNATAFPSLLEAELRAFNMWQADCVLALARPLAPGILPTAPARSFLGDCLARAYPELFTALFEPGRFLDGRQPAAFALRLNGVDPTGCQVAFRVVAWDRHGRLLPALLDAAWQARNHRRITQWVRGFQPGPVDKVTFSLPASAESSNCRVVLDSPHQVRRYASSPASGGKRERFKLKAADAGLRDFLEEALKRIAGLSAAYGSGSFPREPAAAGALAADCKVVSPRLADVQAFGQSSRQGKRIDLSGIVGCMDAEILTPAADALLRAASLLNAGKSTAYGCGGLSLEPGIRLSRDYSEPREVVA